MIRGEQRIDYFNIVCVDCGAITKNEYRGGDPAVPHPCATCSRCRKTMTVKLDATD